MPPADARRRDAALSVRPHAALWNQQMVASCEAAAIGSESSLTSRARTLRPARDPPEKQLHFLRDRLRVGRPVPDSKLLRHNARAGAQLGPQLRLELTVDRRRQIQRHDRGLRDVGGEEIAFDERRAIADATLARV